MYFMAELLGEVKQNCQRKEPLAKTSNNLIVRVAGYSDYFWI